MTREEDIQELCKQILEEDISVSNTYSNGWDEQYCPFCHNSMYYDYTNHIDNYMEKIKHESNCGYLIAKDLSTKGDKQK